MADNSEMTMRQIVGVNVEAARKRMGLSQHELGRRMEQWLDTAWTRQAVSLAEQGKRAFGVDDLVALSVGLRVSVPELLTPPPDTATVALPSEEKLPRVYVEQDILAVGKGAASPRERFVAHLQELDAITASLAERRALLLGRLAELESDRKGAKNHA